MLSIGIDIGSITTKIAVMDNSNLLDSQISFTGYDPENAWKNLYSNTLKSLGLNESSPIPLISTGYGREMVTIANKKVTEIMCHAQGAIFFDSKVRSIIDIGGQDSKFIRINEGGNVGDFVMNDKCAAGTGRFLEVMARALGINISQMGELSLKAKKPSKISSMCTVFAESEVISLISKGETRENIIAGIHESVASRIVSMMGRSGAKLPLLLTGGVAKNSGIKAMLEKKLKSKIFVPETAQVNGAIGAAILAQKL